MSAGNLAQRSSRPCACCIASHNARCFPCGIKSRRKLSTHVRILTKFSPLKVVGIHSRVLTAVSIETKGPLATSITMLVPCRACLHHMYHLGDGTSCRKEGPLADVGSRCAHEITVLAVLVGGIRTRQGMWEAFLYLCAPKPASRKHYNRKLLKWPIHTWMCIVLHHQCPGHAPDSPHASIQQIYSVC